VDGAVDIDGGQSDWVFCGVAGGRHVYVTMLTNRWNSWSWHAASEACRGQASLLADFGEADRTASYGGLAVMVDGADPLCLEDSVRLLFSSGRSEVWVGLQQEAGVADPGQGWSWQLPSLGNETIEPLGAALYPLPDGMTEVFDDYAPGVSERHGVDCGSVNLAWDGYYGVAAELRDDSCDVPRLRPAICMLTY
jgi:hypothetical protein